MVPILVMADLLSDTFMALLRNTVNNDVAYRVLLCDKVLMSYEAPVTKELPIGVRFEPDEIAALKAAAKADQRPVSGLIRKIVVDWLRANGDLKNAE